MKKKLLLIIGALLMMGSMTFAAVSMSPEATCTGSKTCKACKNCKYCKHCAKEKGTCGVCKK